MSIEATHRKSTEVHCKIHITEQQKGMLPRMMMKMLQCIAMI